MTPAPCPQDEIADVAARLEGLAASRIGALKTTLELYARRLGIALLLGERLRKASRAPSK